MNKETRYTVIGAGHGGKAMAADLADRGFSVNLYNRTAERISEIAFEVGFQSLTHFNRVFKRIIGQSPTQYRSQLSVL